MKKSRYSDSQILAILKQAESGVPVPDLCREQAIPGQALKKVIPEQALSNSRTGIEIGDFLRIGGKISYGPLITGLRQCRYDIPTQSSGF